MAGFAPLLRGSQYGQMTRPDDLNPALASFAISFLPNKYVVVAGSDRLVSAIGASGLPQLLTIDSGVRAFSLFGGQKSPPPR